MDCWQSERISVDADHTVPPMKTCDMPEIDLEENAYGHRKRVEWIVAQLKKTDRIVELGCGTGIMITRTLCKLGL